MCNAHGHPEGHACGFGPPYPYAYPVDAGAPAEAVDPEVVERLPAIPGLRVQPEWLVEELKATLPEPAMPLFDDIAGGTLDLSRPGEIGAEREWTAAEHAAFDQEIASMDRTIDALKARVAEADRAGRRLGAEDMTWLNSKQVAGPTGYRSKHYRDSDPCVQETMDAYESWLSPATWRDFIRLVAESVRGKGKGHMNRVLYEIEIGRVTEYRDVLKARKNRKVRQRETMPVP